MTNLTPKQDKILSFIEDFIQQHTVPPSFRQIQAHFNFASPRAATKHVQALIKKGVLSTGNHGSKTSHRNLLPLRPQESEVPLLGKIAAGTPIEAIENITDNLDLLSLGINNTKKDHFALIVKGDSMINAHILDGDWVVIKRQPEVGPHDIAAVLWNGEATLKHVRKKGSALMLIPENDLLQPVTIDPNKVSDFRILGKVVRTIRRY